MDLKYQRGGVGIIEMPGQGDWGRQARELAEYPREDILSKLLNFSAHPRLDFTPEYLSKMSTEQLRHLLMAAMLAHSQN